LIILSQEEVIPQKKEGEDSEEWFHSYSF